MLMRSQAMKPFLGFCIRSLYRNLEAEGDDLYAAALRPSWLPQPDHAPFLLRSILLTMESNLMAVK